MPRSIDIVTESPASVEQINAALAREEYWLARLGGDSAVTLDSLQIEADGGVAVQITQHLGRRILPDLVARAVPGDLKLSYYETWRPDGDGHTRGQATVSAGGLGSSRATNSLAPAGDGSRLCSTVRVEVRIPLLGRKLEQSIAAALSDSVPSMLRFTTTWIDEHP